MNTLSAQFMNLNGYALHARVCGVLWAIRSPYLAMSCTMLTAVFGPSTCSRGQSLINLNFTANVIAQAQSIRDSDSYQTPPGVIGTTGGLLADAASTRTILIPPQVVHDEALAHMCYAIGPNAGVVWGKVRGSGSGGITMNQVWAAELLWSFSAFASDPLSYYYSSFNSRALNPFRSNTVLLAKNQRIGGGDRIRVESDINNDSGSGEYFYFYSVNGAPLPGLNPQSALLSAGTGQGPFGEGDRTFESNLDMDDASELDLLLRAGGQFTNFSSPVVPGDYANTAIVYFDPALAVGYGFIAEEGTRFTSFIIPEALPHGDDLFSIHYAGQSYPLSAGTSFDFAAIDSAGVESFLLLGIDESEVIAANASDPPFVFGMTFADLGNGLAGFNTFPLFIPEPADFNRDALVDGRDFLAWQRGESPDPLSSADLALWQASYGADSSLAVAVPEPNSMWLTFVGVMTLIWPRGQYGQSSTSGLSRAARFRLHRG